jgi:hypothetical protein
MGMTDVAFFAATTASVPAVTITSTFSRMNSVAISAKRSPRPSAQRYSITTVRSSIHPLLAHALDECRSPGALGGLRERT